MNNQYKQKLIKEISQLKNNSHVNQKILYQFIQLIQNQDKLIKKQGADKHISTFFLPIDIESKSIYLVNHIKAEMWIPPGGHIEPDELPIETVKREYKEELNHLLTTEEVKLFNLSITPIDRPWQNCLIHYDFWYSVSIKKLSFDFLRKEFYQGKWFNLEDGLKKISRKPYQNIIKNLIKVL